MNTKKPIFVFCIGGRSGSTFIQRLLNSSDEVVIQGEQISVLECFGYLYEAINQFKDNEAINIDSKLLLESLKTKNHLHFYPNAMLGCLKKDYMKNIITQFLEVEDCELRFGFKDIRILSTSLEMLYNLFPDAKFVFVVRNPNNQWASVKTVKVWEYSYDLDIFLKYYEGV